MFGSRIIPVVDIVTYCGAAASESTGYLYRRYLLLQQPWNARRLYCSEKGYVDSTTRIKRRKIHRKDWRKTFLRYCRKLSGPGSHLYRIRSGQSISAVSTRRRRQVNGFCSFSAVSGDSSYFILKHVGRSQHGHGRRHLVHRGVFV
jgi:hypothetical protein